ncbi:MAG: acyl-CoA thioesterase [Actinobacteria bacterium]|nr:acyl-CoA thioesterase [Actinomycetota bacterium]
MKNPPVVQKIAVRYQDLDPYGHVNNAVHPIYFEAARFAYWRVLGENLGFGPLEAGDLPGVRYVVAEATIRYRAPIFLEDALLCAASIRTIGNRSFVMDYELRTGESFDAARTVAECTSAQVFYEPRTEEVRPRPDWFLPAVAVIEGRPEDSFAPENH